MLLRLGCALGELHTASLTAAARVNLRLHDDHPAKLLRDALSFFGGGGDLPWRHGDTVSEDRLAAELAISRTPVREALLLLQNAGLIQKEVHQPFRVRLVSNREYFQTMRLRELLEGEAIKVAVKKIAPETLASVVEALRAASDPAVGASPGLDDHQGQPRGGALSAGEVAAAVAVSRVTARRYLEHLADAGQVDRVPRYGAPGRPEHEYRWR